MGTANWTKESTLLAKRFGTTLEHAKHTPGPWTYVQDQTFPWRGHIMAGESEVLCTPMAYHISTGDKTIADLIRRDPLNAVQMQNLQLMASAPDLLWACGLHVGDPDGMVVIDRASNIVKDFRKMGIAGKNLGRDWIEGKQFAAIVKATGGNMPESH